VGQREAFLNFAILVLPFAVALLLGAFAAGASDSPGVVGWFTLALYAVGLSLFLVAKVSLVRRGVRFSVGSARMTPWHRRAYRAGYLLMAVGVVATVALVMFAPRGPY